MTLVLSNTKANAFQRCPKKYEFSYVHKLRSRAPALPLRRGDWLHQLLETHYTGKCRVQNDDGEGSTLHEYDHWRDRLEELRADFYELTDIEREPFGDLPGECARIMRSYLRQYRRQDVALKIIDAEIDDVVELPNGDSFRFIIDLIVEQDDGSIWFWDHKTVGRFMDDDFMLMDAQLTRYFWAAKKQLGITARGVLFNEVITTPPTAPELLRNGTLTKRANLVCDYWTYLATIKDHGLDPKDYKDVLTRLKNNTGARWFRRTRLPRSRHLLRTQMQELLMTAHNIHDAEERSHYPRTVSKGCKWDCEYLPLCMTDLVGGDVTSIIQAKYELKRRDKR